MSIPKSWAEPPMDLSHLKCQKHDGWSYTSYEVLPFLKGLPWGDVANAYVSTLRPSEVRFAHDRVHLDAMNWRVTVWVEADGKTIGKITQEVAINVPPGENGGTMSEKLHGMRSARP